MKKITTFSIVIILLLVVTIPVLSDIGITFEKIRNNIPLMYYRQGGDIHDWSVSGTEKYDVIAPKIQSGTKTITINNDSVKSETVISFPSKFKETPIVIVSINGSSRLKGNIMSEIVVVSQTRYEATIAIELSKRYKREDCEVSFSWFAIGK